MNGNLQSQIRLFQNERCTRFQEETDHLWTREQPHKSWLESLREAQQMLTTGRENALSVSSMHKPHNLAV